jgi:PTS system galactitol-specific IIB component
MTKKVYVVCATGIATSTMIRVKIEEFLKKNGIQATIYQYRVTELSPSRVDADVIVATTEIPTDIAQVAPVVNALPLITGIGESEALQKILDILQSKE